MSDKKPTYTFNVDKDRVRITRDDGRFVEIDDDAVIAGFMFLDITLRSKVFDYPTDGPNGRWESDADVIRGGVEALITDGVIDFDA